MSQLPPDEFFNLDMFFQEPQGAPLPPDEVRIRSFEAIPWESAKTIVKIHLQTTPFLRRPSAEIRILNPQGEITAEASIFGAMAPHSEINMHLRGNVPAGVYTAQCTLFYERMPENQEAEGENAHPTPEIMIVDRAQHIFTLSTD
ncbi:MAG: hypothetical protein Fur0018_11540 [Anaerolineales bacterium]